MLLDSIVTILERGLNTNSYKFALLRALADYGRQGAASDLISFEWLAERFLAYYWPLTVQFRVRQSTDAAKDPVIMKFIRREVAELQMPSDFTLDKFRRGHQERYAKLLDRCVSKGGCFDEVISRFHNLRSGQVKEKLYDADWAGVRLRPNVLPFLASQCRALSLLAIGAWVRFTEQYTTAPRLYEKIAGTKPDRKHEKYRTDLLAIDGPACFYCGGTSEKTLHVDHFLPWSYVLEDRLWNLVLACETCNSQKSDQTPADPFVEKLLRRNLGLLDRVNDGQASDVSMHAVRDLREFTAARLEENLRTLIANCRADEFGVWQGPPAAPSTRADGRES